MYLEALPSLLTERTVCNMPSTSPIGSKNNVKIFILYLMSNIGYPLDYISINDIVMQSNYVVYLDFGLCFFEMLDAGLIEVSGKDSDGNDLYSVTSKGRLVADELKSDVVYSVLDESLEEALRYLDFKKRGVSAVSTIDKLPDGKYKVNVFLTEKDVLIFNTSMVLDSFVRAQKFRENFLNRPEVVYRGVCALLAGNVNYLFDKDSFK